MDERHFDLVEHVDHFVVDQVLLVVIPEGPRPPNVLLRVFTDRRTKQATRLAEGVHFVAEVLEDELLEAVLASEALPRRTVLIDQPGRDHGVDQLVPDPVAAVLS